MKIKNLSLIFLFCGMQSLAFAQSSPIYVNGNNVGIGTTTPVMKLDVSGGGVHIGYDPADGNLGKLAFHHNNINSQDRYYSGVLYNNASGMTALVGARYDIRYWNAPGFGVQFSAATWDDTQYKYVFRKDMYLDGSSGNLGVGTNQPTQKLHVIGNARIETGIETGGTVTANRFVGDGSGLRNLSSVSSQWGSGGNGAISYLGGNVGIGTIRPDTALTIERNRSKTPAFRTYTGVVNEEITSFNAIEGLQLMCYQNVDGSPSTKASVIVANGDGIAPSQLEIWTKELGSSSPSRRIIVSSIGKVGIGIAEPNTQLYVNAASNGSIATFASLDGVFNPRLLITGTSAGTGLFANYSSAANSLMLGVDNSEKMRITESGNVGIGTKTPTQKLQVKGQILVNQNEGSTSGLYLRSDAAPTHYNWKISTQEVVDGGFEISSSTVPGGTTFKRPIFVINQNGKVGIGDIYPTNELTVSGSIKAKDIIISQVSWADFVFEPGYRLRPLPELESFILTQKHLPDVPTEKEVVSKGMSVASMQKLHMQKIEELTLYVIALEKENKKLKEAQDDLLKRMVRLETQSR